MKYCCFKSVVDSEDKCEQGKGQQAPEIWDFCLLSFNKISKWRQDKHSPLLHTSWWYTRAAARVPLIRQAYMVKHTQGIWDLLSILTKCICTANILNAGAKANEHNNRKYFLSFQINGSCLMYRNSRVQHQWCFENGQDGQNSTLPIYRVDADPRAGSMERDKYYKLWRTDRIERFFSSRQHAEGKAGAKIQTG